MVEIQFKWITQKLDKNDYWVISCPICQDSLLNKISIEEALCRKGHQFNIKKRYDEEMMPFRKINQDLINKLAKLAFD